MQSSLKSLFFCLVRDRRVDVDRHQPDTPVRDLQVLDDLQLKQVSGGTARAGWYSTAPRGGWKAM